MKRTYVVLVATAVACAGCTTNPPRCCERQPIAADAGPDSTCEDAGFSAVMDAGRVWTGYEGWIEIPNSPPRYSWWWRAYQTEGEARLMWTGLAENKEAVFFDVPLATGMDWTQPPVIRLDMNGWGLNPESWVPVRYAGPLKRAILAEGFRTEAGPLRYGALTDSVHLGFECDYWGDGQSRSIGAAASEGEVWIISRVDLACHWNCQASADTAALFKLNLDMPDAGMPSPACLYNERGTTAGSVALHPSKRIGAAQTMVDNWNRVVRLFEFDEEGRIIRDGEWGRGIRLLGLIGFVPNTDRVLVQTRGSFPDAGVAWNEYYALGLTDGGVLDAQLLPLKPYFAEVRAMTTAGGQTFFLGWPRPWLAETKHNWLLASVDGDGGVRLDIDPTPAPYHPPDLLSTPDGGIILVQDANPPDLPGASPNRPNIILFRPLELKRYDPPDAAYE